MKKTILSLVFATAFSMLAADAYNNYQVNPNANPSYSDSNRGYNQGYLNPNDQRSSQMNPSANRGFMQQNPNDQGFSNSRSQGFDQNRGFNDQNQRAANPYLSDSYNPSNPSDSSSQYGQGTVADKDIFAQLQKKLGPGWFSKGYENVSFDVRNGNVLLRGSVDKMEDKDKVEKIVRGIDGVKSVTDQITVSEKNYSSPAYR
jgi:hypothetical protein